MYSIGLFSDIDLTEILKERYNIRLKHIAILFTTIFKKFKSYNFTTPHFIKKPHRNHNPSDALSSYNKLFLSISSPTLYTRVCYLGQFAYCY